MTRNALQSHDEQTLVAEEVMLAVKLLILELLNRPPLTTEVMMNFE